MAHTKGSPKDSFAEPEPMYSCSVRGCAEEVSYPVDMLKVHDGKVICEGCWDCADAVLNEDDDPISWYELEAFVPAASRRIAELEAQSQWVPASEVKEQGWYWVQDSIQGRELTPYYIRKKSDGRLVLGVRDVTLSHFGIRDCQFSGPIPPPPVTP